MAEAFRSIGEQSAGRSSRKLAERREVECVFFECQAAVKTSELTADGSSAFSLISDGHCFQCEMICMICIINFGKLEN